MIESASATAFYLLDESSESKIKLDATKTTEVGFGADAGLQPSPVQV